MTQFTFSIPTNIQFGPGISRQAGSAAKSLAAAHAQGTPGGVLIIVDPGIQSAPWVGEILASVREAGLSYRLFDAVKPNPRDSDVHSAAALLSAENLGAIIAIGGGSTMDTAKGAALLAEYGGKIGDYAGWGKVPGPAVPVVAIPTTAGSGSEATSWAVITDSASHAKLAIGDRSLAPAAALVDPQVTVFLPAGLTAATGMDALTHSIEAFISPLSSPINDLLALESIRLVGANLCRAVADGSDLQAREGMMLASTLGGIAINNADVAGVHCLSEGMGSLYDAPHGLLNAVLLPYCMAFWQDSCRPRFARIAEALGGAPRPEEALVQVLALIQALKLPALPDIGVKEADLPRLAALAEANVSNTSNPLPMAAADYLAILRLAMTGRPPAA